MKTFTGKWCMTSQEGWEAFYTAIGTPDPMKTKMCTMMKDMKTDHDTWVEEWIVDTTTMMARRTTYFKGVMTRDTGLIPMGKDFTYTLPDGRTCTGMLTMEMDTMMMMMKLTAPMFDATIKYTLTPTGTEMTGLMTTGTTTATQKMTKMMM